MDELPQAILLDAVCLLPFCPLGGGVARFVSAVGCSISDTWVCMHLRTNLISCASADRPDFLRDSPLFRTANAPESEGEMRTPKMCSGIVLMTTLDPGPRKFRPFPQEQTRGKS